MCCYNTGCEETPFLTRGVFVYECSNLFVERKID